MRTAKPHVVGACNVGACTQKAYHFCAMHLNCVFSTPSLFADVDCGNLTDPANGQVDLTSGTTFGQTATYSCNTGYNLVGDSTHTCQATGNWSGSAPTCQGMLLKVLFICVYK